jgi:small subunit ribosomal protein S16
MVRIRLRRTGKKGQASYRIVVADSESPRDGRFIENIGFYNPRTEPPTIEIEADRARYWLSVGAQPSEPAARLLRKVGVLAGGVEAPAKTVEPKAEAVIPEEEVEEEVEEEAEEEVPAEETDADAE